MSHRFGEDCSILYTDTDSLIYLITRDPYEVMREDCYQYFDTSDYPLDNIQKIPLVNKKVIGLMKDENNGKIMSDFVGLRSKLYATRLNTTNNEVHQLWEKYQKEEYDEDEIKEIIMNHDVTKKAKGVKKSVIKNKITFEDYVECLETNKHKITSQNLIRSEKHKVFTIKQEKLSLSCEDDKRYLIPGTFDTFAWGHFSIPHDHEAMDID
uniref:Uncharacterized protein LOC114338283 n=1 Tax=Diabrotica virgifera virgifera TaxID=50390 RepID=A0A6P7GLM1_DIAVI